jgi:hypothetical protein
VSTDAVSPVCRNLGFEHLNRVLIIQEQTFLHTVDVEAALRKIKRDHNTEATS